MGYFRAGQGRCRFRSEPGWHDQPLSNRCPPPPPKLVCLVWARPPHLIVVFLIAVVVVKTCVWTTHEQVVLGSCGSSWDPSTHSKSTLCYQPECCFEQHLFTGTFFLTAWRSPVMSKCGTPIVVLPAASTEVPVLRRCARQHCKRHGCFTHTRTCTHRKHRSSCVHVQAVGGRNAPHKHQKLDTQYV